MEFINGGLKHFYQDTGPVSGANPEDTLVLLHGFPHTHWLWKPQVPELSKRRRVVTYDLRGFGASGGGDGHLMMDFFVDDLLALLDHLGLEKAVIAGLSMGGYVALRAIELHPERFRALILCNTASKADTNAAKEKRVKSIRQIREQGFPAFVRDYSEDVFMPETLERDPKQLESFRRMILENRPESVIAGFIALAARTDTTESLAKITVPTLVIGGEKDPIFPATKEMHEQLPHARLVVIPGVGHLSNLESPDVFNAAIEEFYAEFSDRVPRETQTETVAGLRREGTPGRTESDRFDRPRSVQDL
jgi:pimeloyl-ACP methyl ester carboxylesterase